MKFYDLGNTHHKTTQARLSVGISLPPHLPILLSPPFLNFSFIFSLQLFSIFFPLPSTFLTFAEAHICLEIVVHEFEEKGYCLCFWTKKHGSNFQYTDKLANKYSLSLPRWGYKFCRRSFGVTEENYYEAMEILGSLVLDDIIY
ncbi:hypothetical protein P8452_37964 [Trifolium repens]|nr:hypothetical protein P8452_37964 [Trifolium repens]